MITNDRLVLSEIEQKRTFKATAALLARKHLAGPHRPLGADYERNAKKWTMPIHHWREALNHFTILWQERMPALGRVASRERRIFETWPFAQRVDTPSRSRITVPANVWIKLECLGSDRLAQF